MSKPDTIIKVNDLEFLVSRIIGIDKSDTVNANFHLKIYLVSDAAFTIEFDTVEKRDEAYRSVSAHFHDYISLPPANSKLDINLVSEFTVLKKTNEMLTNLKHKIESKAEAYSHVGMIETVNDDLQGVNRILDFVNQYVKKNI